jgi:hypothetical protein
VPDLARRTIQESKPTLSVLPMASIDAASWTFAMYITLINVAIVLLFPSNHPRHSADAARKRETAASSSGGMELARADR